MNYFLIKRYIDLITKDDIKTFSIKENINITNDEIDIIYYTIKNRYNDIFNDGLKVIDSIKNNISYSLYLKLIELYNEYKKRLKI